MEGEHWSMEYPLVKGVVVVIKAFLFPEEHSTP